MSSRIFTAAAAMRVVVAADPTRIAPRIVAAARAVAVAALVGAVVVMAGCAARPLDHPFATNDLGVVADLASPGAAVADLATVTATDMTLVDPTIAAPRPMAPLSTARVTSRRPTLRWQLAPGSDGARIDLCRDRSCTQRLTTLTATGGSTRPADDLPAGIVFWRARGTHGGAVGIAVSATWEMSIGFGSAGDTSWGSTLDLDGDGYSDLALYSVTGLDAQGLSNDAMGELGVIFGNRVSIYRGGPDGLATTASTVINAPALSRYVAPGLADGGDLDGDGYGDLIIGVRESDSDLGQQNTLYVYPGGPGGPSVPSTSITLPGWETSMAAVGDVNGDGYGDFAVAMCQLGQVQLFYGGPNGLSPIAAATYAGCFVSSLGDFDGDGLDDFGVSGGYGGTMQAYAGSLAGPVALTTLPYGGFALASDINGDGRADIIFGHNYLRTTPDAPSYSIEGAAALPSGMSIDYGAASSQLSALGDCDGDGFDDVAVGVENSNNVVGQPTPTYAAVYRGSSSGITTATTLQLRQAHEFGNDAPLLGGSYKDYNGDGLGDLAIISPNFANGATGCVYVYYGARGGLATMPATTLCGGTNDGFGVEVVQRTRPTPRDDHNGGLARRRRQHARDPRARRRG